MKLDNGLSSERVGGKIRLFDEIKGREVIGDSVRHAAEIYHAKYYEPVIAKYKNVDIDKPLRLDVLVDIFQAFTNSCTKGIPVWLEQNKDLVDRAKGKGVSIREVCERLEEEYGALRFKAIFIPK